MQLFKLWSFSYRIEIDVWYDTFQILGSKANDKMPSPKIPNTYITTGALSVTATSEQVLSVQLPPLNRCSQFSCHIRTGALNSTATTEQVLSAPLPQQNTCSQLNCHIITGGWLVPSLSAGFHLDSKRVYKQALYNTDPHMYLALTWFWIISPRSLPTRRYLGDAPEVTYWSHFWANLDTLCFSGQIGLAVTAPDMNWIRVPETL